ncbi:MAG: SurA N-terminal domain-containing protein [Hyphomicrobiaceae bacterium]
MLDTLRNSANSWLAKILLGLVAVSFVYWGADTRSTRTGVSSLATVGSATITQNDFQRAYENEIAQLSQRAGRRVTSDEARAYGIDRRVMSRLIGSAALDSQVATLGLALSDETVAENLRNDLNFKGIDGKFDHNGFQQFLRSIGITERAFLDQRRKEEERAQLTSTLLSAIVTPKPIVAAVHAWKDETRVAEFLMIDASKAVTVADPDATKLKETYEANKAQFMAPEFRKLQILLLSVNELKAQMDVPDAEVAASYEQTKENYSTPEVRRIQQIPFKDKAAAEAAKAEIAGGKNFMKVAEDAGVKEKDLDLGLITKKSMIDKKIAEAAFAIERDKVSDVVEGTFATVLLRVPEIKPGKQPTLDDLKAEIKDKLARAKAKDEVQKLRDSADDMRNAAKSDKEIADALKLKIVEVEQTDTTNKTSDGKAAFEHPDARALIASGFDAKTGVERDPVELADGGYAWVTSTNITPARQKPFEEVEAGVKALYFTSERKRLVQDLASKLVERANKGEAFEALAPDAAGKADKTPVITRTTTPQGLTEQAVTQIFGLPLARAGSAETNDKSSRTIFRVLEIIPAKAPTKDDTAKLTQEVGQSIQVDILDSYVAALQDAAGVTINDAELRRMAGSPQAQ